MKTNWVRGHRLSENVPVKYCIYVVDDAEEELTTYRRNVAPRAATVKQQLLGDILGGLKTLTGRESAENPNLKGCCYNIPCRF